MCLIPSLSTTPSLPIPPWKAPHREVREGRRRHPSGQETAAVGYASWQEAATAGHASREELGAIRHASWQEAAAARHASREEAGAVGPPPLPLRHLRAPPHLPQRQRLHRDLRLDDNSLVGPAPALHARGANVSFSHNGFCGAACAPEVTALLSFLADVGFPQRLAESWAGNDPCKDWLGVSCYQGKVTLLNLTEYGLNGSVSASLGNLSALSDVRLNDNNLTGRVPDSLAGLKSLRKLDLSTNDLTGPLPAFSHDVSVNVDGNPSFNGPAPAHRSPTPPSTPADSPSGDNNTNTNKKSALVLAVTIPVAVTVLALVSLGAVLLFRKKSNNCSVQPQASSVVVHPRDGSDPDNLVKIVMASNDSFGGTSSATSSRDSDMHMIETRNFVIAVQVLRRATKNFAQDNVLGRGGFGVVYKGVLHDGTMIAVKRMESSVISNKALDEFQAEIAILTKVRHRNLVSILGYSIEGNERLLLE